ncbi:MAG: hypothetical protein WDZ54_00520 [Sneathiella sp.]
MDLKEFIVETISAIADATNELQTSYENDEILVNPPTSQSGENVYLEGSGHYAFRHVRDVDFDVALTASSSLDAKGKAGLKVFSVEVGGGGGASKAQEQVSRVQFSIPIALKPTASEGNNLEIAKRQAAQKNKRKFSKGATLR